MSRDDGFFAPLQRAFDELRFGPSRTLNLRTQQPTARQAATLTESWLRTLQVQGAADALVITGRGNRSVDGVSPVRQAVVQLLPSLRRRNIISAYAEHTPGSFVVTFAPIRALFETPYRRRERRIHTPLPMPSSLAALDEVTQVQLREVACMSLEALGLRTPTHDQITNEMLRQFAALTSSLTDNVDREAMLQQALMRVKEEFDDAY